jgi:hypothetical protein
MASGRVPRTAMTLQGFGNCVHSTEGGRSTRNSRAFAACREATLKPGKDACPHCRPCFRRWRTRGDVCYRSVNREAGIRESTGVLFLPIPQVEPQVSQAAVPRRAG